MIGFFMALAVAIVFNADTFSVGERLWENPALRQEFAAMAQASAEKGLADAQNAELGEAKRQLTALPLGWRRPDPNTGERVFQAPSCCLNMILKGFGLLLTGFLVSLGGPFWFDTMAKLLPLRASGPKPNRVKKA